MIPPDFAIPHDTELMRRWRAAGLATIGRTTTPEFGYNTNTEALVYGSTRNPWNTLRIAGGSSGGSCALVAARGLPAAHASDGGGSIRYPAALCGLVGLKPTRGRISPGPDAAEALFGMSASFAVTRSVRDAAALLDAVEGHGIGEKYEIARPARAYAQEIRSNPGRLRIAISPRGWSNAPTEPSCVAAVEGVAKLLADMGHHVAQATPAVDGEAFEVATMNLFAVGMAGWILGLAAKLGVKAGPENLESTVWAAVEHGTTLSTMDLLATQSVVNTICRKVGAFFQDYDVLLTPSSTGPAPPLGQPDANGDYQDLATFHRGCFSYSPFTALFNATGQPAISLPLCVSADGLPIGLQFVSRYGDEATLFRLAGALEAALPWASRRPQVCAGES